MYVVDDDAAVRSALELLLESVGHNVKSYASADAFLEAYKRQQPGCLVLDVKMPDMTGLELQETLVERLIRIPIIFITGHGDVPMSVKALKGGAEDFFEKPFDDQAFLDRVSEALAKDVELRRQEAEVEDIGLAYGQLTPREQQVMALVIEGKSSREIADALNLSPRTIEVHRARVMEKMGAGSLSELVAMAIACGVYSLDRV